jgi:uncharacterized repeat protein (TIGR01451 family)
MSTKWHLLEPDVANKNHFMNHHVTVHDIMRRTPAIILVLTIATAATSGCATPRGIALWPRPATNATAATPVQVPVQKNDPRQSAALPLAIHDTPTIAQVSHFDDLSCGPGASCEPSASSASCGPCMADNGCGHSPCHSGYLPYPTAYFNPYLIDPNEYICDGGDNEPRARARAGDAIAGVDLEDTVARYRTDAGEVRVEASNRVCLYAPRFAAVRKVTGAESGELAVGAIRIERPQGPINAQLNQPGLAVTGRDQPGRGAAVRGPDALRERNRGVPVERVLQPEMAADVLPVLANLSLVNRGILRDNEKPWLSMAAQSAVIWSVDTEVAVTVNHLAPVTLTRDQGVEELVVYEFPDGRLRICKLADKSDALPGETVTFILRVDNVGDSPLHDIVVTDNLVTRLEYIEGSQTSTIDAKFTVEANDGQSLRLTWKLEKSLKVGEGATIEFKCKVR